MLEVKYLLLVILTYGMETTFFRFVNKEGENSEKVYHTVLSMVGFPCAMRVLAWRPTVRIRIKTL